MRWALVLLLATAAAATAASRAAPPDWDAALAAIPAQYHSHGTPAPFPPVVHGVS
mgnify:CR=1 FL=1